MAGTRSAPTLHPEGKQLSPRNLNFLRPGEGPTSAARSESSPVRSSWASMRLAGCSPVGVLISKSEGASSPIWRDQLGFEGALQPHGISVF